MLNNIYNLIIIYNTAYVLPHKFPLDSYNMKRKTMFQAYYLVVSINYAEVGLTLARQWSVNSSHLRSTY